MMFSQILTDILPKKTGVLGAFLLYFSSLLALFFYSFTQVDLSLTITRRSFWQPIQNAFQHIGYFNRPLSTGIFLLIIFLLFVSYFLLFRFAKQGFLRRRSIWGMIIFSSIIFIFSYNAFSYDIFNYIFDAKIITFYHANPYLKKALDYPGDPMLSFMHWTHRTYPYGPSWLFLTVPLSFSGLQYFLPTYFLFKTLIIFCFVGTAYYVEKIAEKIKEGSGISSVVFFALNPLVIIESLVSSHNDIVMIFFAVLSFWLILRRKVVFGFFSLLFSIGIKFATGLLFPIFAYIFLKQRFGKPVNLEKAVMVMGILMVAALGLATYRTNFQPWYFLYAMPFVSLLSRKNFIRIPTIIFSFGASLQYIPYLYLGNYDPPVPTVLWELFFVSGAVSLGAMVLFSFKSPRS